MNANECNAQWEYSYSIHKEGAHVANAALARRGPGLRRSGARAPPGDPVRAAHVCFPRIHVCFPRVPSPS